MQVSAIGEISRSLVRSHGHKDPSLDLLTLMRLFIGKGSNSNVTISKNGESHSQGNMSAAVGCQSGGNNQGLGKRQAACAQVYDELSSVHPQGLRYSVSTLGYRLSTIRCGTARGQLRRKGSISEHPYLMVHPRSRRATQIASYPGLGRPVPGPISSRPHCQDHECSTNTTRVPGRPGRPDRPSKHDKLALMNVVLFASQLVYGLAVCGHVCKLP